MKAYRSWESSWFRQFRAGKAAYFAGGGLLMQKSGPLKGDLPFEIDVGHSKKGFPPELLSSNTLISPEKKVKPEVLEALLEERSRGR